MIDKRLEQIADHYGEFSQMHKLIEELGELNAATSRYITLGREFAKDKKVDVEKNTRLFYNLVEEIADVEIMLEQIIYLFDLKGKVEQTKEIKIKRQLARIAAEMREK